MCNPSTLASLHAARLIANHAKARGLPQNAISSRVHFAHMGALLCDSVLQAGVNYRTVVAKRTRRVIEKFPYANDLLGIRVALNRHGSEFFLDWNHQEKVSRFNDLVRFMEFEAIGSVHRLRDWMSGAEARSRLQSVRGVGPKTFDYMACLIGIECIPIDRHLRTFASSAGVEDNDYDSLHRSFALAADLLRIRRSHLDWWVWTTVSTQARSRKTSCACPPPARVGHEVNFATSTLSASPQVGG